MTMRRITSILAVFVLIAGSIVLVPSPARAQGGAAKWSIGDFWEYSGETIIYATTYSVIVRVKVDHKADLTVGSQSYETFNCSVSGAIAAGTTSIGIEGYINFGTSNLSRVRVWYKIPIMGGWTASTYDPPLQDFQFPLSDGQVWSSTGIENSTSSFGSSSRVVTYDYSVSGPTSLTVPAGTFSTFAIREDSNGVAAPGIMDYSDAVGFAVRLNGTVMGLSLGGITVIGSGLELKSYSYSAGSSAGSIMVLLLIVVIIIVVIAVIVLLLVRFRRKARFLVPPPPSQYGQTVQQPVYRPPSPPSPPQ